MAANVGIFPQYLLSGGLSQGYFAGRHETHRSRRIRKEKQPEQDRRKNRKATGFDEAKRETWDQPLPNLNHGSCFTHHAPRITHHVQ